MVVYKVLNNNIVSSLDERGREVLLVGRGLGWQAKAGEPVDKKKIDKIFRMDTGASTEKLKQLFLEVDVEVIELSVQIIDHAREVLKKKLNKNVYITLTDHISFAIERSAMRFSGRPASCIQQSTKSDCTPSAGFRRPWGLSFRGMKRVLSHCIWSMRSMTAT